MNFINVDPAVYYEAATIVNRAASAFFAAYDQHLQALKGTAAMAGSAGPGKEWATSYDNQVRETNNLVSTLMLALDKYPRILNQAGYVYASSDHDPKSGTPAPQKPADPQLAYVSCAQPPPSAGGPGSGLIDDGLELAKQIGVDLPVPDGDTDKLNTAATVWNSLAHAPGATNLPVELERAAAMFQQVTAPEVASIDEDLREIKTAAEDLLAIFADIAASCAAQKTAHDNMKARLHDMLAQFADELKKQVAITLALAVAASVVSFGIGGGAVAAIRAGKAVDLVNDLVKALRGIVAAAGLRTVVAVTRSTGDTRAKLERIHDLIETIEDSVEAQSKPEKKSGIATTPEEINALIDELEQSGVKFSREDIVSIGRDADGKVVFLEKGNDRAGLEHILRHSGEFGDKGIPESEIPNLVMKAVTEGEVVGTQGKNRPVYEILHNGQPVRIAVSVGSNGFVVGANPAS
ncbi:hypothetical protein [Nocardia fusca]|uniref:hypothetical protein n=1 Tax=Nocardia fusca TaxID=941183 RepID=UPI0007A74B33|nr:hypothetical protein [Nocardia fusca]